MGYVLSDELYKGLRNLPTFLEADHFLGEINNYLSEIVDEKGYDILHGDYLNHLADSEDKADRTRNKNISESTEESTSYITIDIGNKKDVIRELRNLISSKVALSETDKEDIEVMVKEMADDSDMNKAIPDEIPFRENLSYVTKILMQQGNRKADDLGKMFKTATDVLRLAVSFSDGDISLSEKPYFRKFAHSEKVMLLGLLNTVPQAEQDMIRYREEWLRLGEIIHPTRFKKRFPRAHRAYSIIRSNRRIKTVLSEIEETYKKGDIETTVKHLEARPGEFARRLDSLLRNVEEEKEQGILDKFEGVIHKVSHPVLYQVRNHFKKRERVMVNRVITPKGSGGDIHLVDKEEKNISESICSKVVEMVDQTLITAYTKKDEIGKVYIDPALKDYVMPLSERNSSKQMNPIIQGTKIPLGDKDTLRFFAWWRNQETTQGSYDGRIDLDLSATFLSEEMEQVEGVSYTNLEVPKIDTYHSGDIMDAPEGATEFIDISKSKVLKEGYRYIVMSLHSYSMQPFSQIPEASAGFMSTDNRSDMNKLYDPKNVVSKFDLDSPFTATVPLIFDLVENAAYWADIKVGGIENVEFMTYGNSRENYLNKIKSILNAVTKMKKTTLYDLYKLHATARGEQLHELPKKQEDRENITVFTVPTKENPLDIPDIVSNYI